MHGLVLSQGYHYVQYKWSVQTFSSCLSWAFCVSHKLGRGSWRGKRELGLAFCCPGKMGFRALGLGSGHWEWKKMSKWEWDKYFCSCQFWTFLFRSSYFLNSRSTIFVFSGLCKAKTLQSMRIFGYQTTWREQSCARLAVKYFSTQNVVIHTENTNTNQSDDRFPAGRNLRWQELVTSRSNILHVLVLF